MKLKLILGLFISLLTIEFTLAQTTSNVSVDGPGWKRVAYRTGSAARGFGKITVFTIGGGNNTPLYLDIEWFKSWTTDGGISVNTNSKSGFWSGARLTYDQDTCFIEVNFTRAISNFSLLSDNYGWNAAKLYSGPLTSGGGTVRAEARAARFNIENQFTVAYNGNVGVGTATPTSKLAVNGNIRAKEIKVEATNWPDYVFGEDYELKSLSELEGYINKYGHLPEIPKAAEVEADGVSLGEMNKLLLKKVEELTLYLIEQQKEINYLKNR